MIKHLAHIWLLSIALAVALVSCHDAPQHYDSRLVAADSLIYAQFDSVYAQLKAINRNSLNSDADKAYYDLLLTQARYLSYITFTSAKDINNAIDYYENHSQELEKLTRSYLYKGAVMEDMGIPDTAMIFYKLAEVTAAPHDDFNRGYAQLRMGKLYASHSAHDGRDIEKLEQAVENFRHCNDIHYQILSLKELGAVTYWSELPKAERILKEAISLAKQEDDIDNFINASNILAMAYFNSHDTKNAYRQLQHIKALDMSGFPDNVYTTFASVYAHMGKPDSAQMFLDYINPETVREGYPFLSNYLEAQSNIAKARGDLTRFYMLSHLCDSVTFTELKDPYIVNLMYAEKEIEKQHEEKINKAAQRKQRNIALVVAPIMIALLALALLFYRRAHRYDRLIVELKDQSRSQMSELTDMQQNISQLQINDERLKEFIASHTGMMREMIEACYHEPNNRIAENMKRIVKFQDSNRDNWEKLYAYIDMEHNNIMTRTRDRYPQLNERDLLLLALTCMGYSYIQTAIIMGYSNATSVSVIKQRLAKKMGLDCTLNEYIERNATAPD